MSGQVGAAQRTLFDKIWDAQVVVPETAETPAVLYVDLHLVHEVTSPQAFAELRARGLPVRRPERTVATMDHAVPTAPARSGRLVVRDPAAAEQVETLRRNCRDFGIRLFDLDSPERGIVHVVGPERGLTQPGMTVVCGDSHTSTHGAFGALAFGIGTSEVGHVLATQCVLARRPPTMAVRLEGRMGRGVSAKDVVLAWIAAVGTDGASGHAVEFCGSAVRAMSMDERMTLCNMSIEAGARCGMIAPDETTFAYLEGRDEAPVGWDWEAALLAWRALPSDPGAAFDREVTLDVDALEPMITWGTSPGMAMPIGGRVPDAGGDPARARALRMMRCDPGDRMLGRRIDVVFLGSCTNSRLSDLRAAAEVLRGRRVAPGVRCLVVPGSQEVKRQAEAEGLDRVFRDAGAEWRESGCSMCLAMNEDRLAPGELAVSTSNRNFEGRQGSGGRTLLASPWTAAAAAVRGVVTDPRTLLPGS